MAGSGNKGIPVGHPGGGPGGRRPDSGGMVVNLGGGASEAWRDKKSGGRREKTEWHQVVIFNENLGKVAEQYLKKGMKVYIEGALQTRKWEKDGIERYSTEIVLQKFRGELQMLDARGQGGEGGQVGSYSGGGGGYGRGSDFGQSGPNDAFDRGGSGGGRSGGGGSRDLDDEIPF